ncbi:FadD7 family fatty acid--CoA ligase [Actinacidiphila glaucinigra]|uniref:FadD7 family fatty acid--CoA ligase n=1 Tax=Actinacidiphila glaucinigra TaxID=235986 RepID=UPI002E31E365|nr:FadD7 family fatty acid--CoA ligase [Actinacidiphila glaucinigra]
MAVPAAASVRDPGRYRPPALTGLTDLLDPPARGRPQAPALITGADRARVSYRALDELADAVAARLAAAGLRPGDAVGLVSANTVEFVAALLGGARAGLVVAPVDPALPEPRMTAGLEALGVRAVLLGPTAGGAPPAAVGPGVPAWTLRVDLSPAGTATAALDTGAGAPAAAGGAAGELGAQDALVLFTAGTTDRAKMVPLTHGAVAAAVRGVCAVYELGPEDATVAAMPFFHGHGLFAALLSTLASGGCVLLPARGRFSAHTFWDDMRAAGATWFTAVPTIHEILLERAATDLTGTGPQVPALRFLRSSSAPLNTATQRALERTLGAPLLSAYGMTESAHQATSEPLPQHGPLKHGSVGRPAGVELRVLDPDGKPCPPGGEGEVWVHGPTVARGYLGNPGETAYGFVDGWFRTGDLGALDEDGHLFLTGRLKNIIIRGGEKVSPEHVEDVLAGCPGVAEAAVFAVPDATYGQRVGAAVVLSPAEGPGSEAPGAEEVRRYCRGRLAPFEVPDRIRIVTSLPHTAKGGLDRAAVDLLYAQDPVWPGLI